MREVVGVVVLPGTDLLPGLAEGREQCLVQQLVPEAPVEALDEAVLHRLARRDVVPFDAGALAPRQDRHRGQLRVVVADHHGRAPPPGDHGVKLPGDAMSRQRRVRHQRQALAAVVVDHGQHPEPASVRQRVADEVEAPADVRRIWQQHRPTRAEGPLPAAPATHLELLLPIEPPQLLEVHHDPLPLKQMWMRR